MANADFHDKEIDTFIEECTTENVTDNDLLLRYKEDITQDNLLQSSNSTRRKLRDFLDGKGVPCGKGTGDNIQLRLLGLINATSPYPIIGQSSAPSFVSTPQISPTNTAKRDFLKVSRNLQDQYSGPYDGPIISAVKRRFLQDCDAFEVPEAQRLSVLHVMLRDDALRYFTDNVVSTVSTIDDAFQKLQEHFMTPAHLDTYTTEWNTLKFSDIRQKNPGKETSEILDLPFQRARDLQTLLDEPYNSPLLLRDCIIRAVKSEPFYAPLITTTIPPDPNTLHTRLHQCIRQQETANPQPAPSSSSAVYLVDQDNEEGEEELELHYSNSGTPYFKRRIMRGSSSFSTPDYRGNRENFRGRGQRRAYRSGSFRYQKRVTFAPVKNATDMHGKTLLCSFCNSWFHLFRNCPDRPNATLHYGDVEDTPRNDEPQSGGTPGPPETLHMDRSIDEYNFATTPTTNDPTAPTTTIVPATKDEHAKHTKFQMFYLSLAYNIEQEVHNPPHEHYHHSRLTISPNAEDVNAMYPDLPYDKRVTYHGICFDEGAPHSVTGLNQWIAYLRTYHVPAVLRKIENRNSSIIFGGKGKNKLKVRSIGTVTIRVPLPASCFFDYRSFVISNDVPMLLGLSTQTKLMTVTDKDPLNPTATFKAIGVTLPLTRKLGHLYYEGPAPNEYLFSMAELAQVHRNLGHAPAGSVYSALRRSYPFETGSSDLEKLRDIGKQCKGCQLFAKQPNRYRAVLPDQCVFNYDVAIDVMFIHGNAILHAVCRQTHFSRAAPLPKQDSYTMWYTFMTIWVVPYLGVPYNLWVDQAKAFLSLQFKTLAHSLGCNLVPIAVEAHWSLIAERYHDPLRRIVNKLIVDHPAAPLSLVIDYANLAMSHTVGPEGFTPAILAFGAQPRLPIGNYKQQSQTVTNRMDLMTSARREYEAIVAQLRIRRALHAAPPNESIIELTPGDDVLVYREKKGWDGPYTFLYRDGRLAVVLDDKGLEHLFHGTMIKPYTRPNLPIQDLLNPVDENEGMQANLVEIVKDERDPRFTESRQKEYEGIVAKGGVKPIPRTELPKDANFIGNRFVLTIKEPGTTNPIYKARWILQGHQDRYRHSIANNSPMLMRMMLRVILSLAVIFFNCTLWTRDVEQAYMQSKPLQRDVFTEPPPEANLPNDQVLKIELPHYGLVEASSCFFDTYYPVFIKKLGMLSAAFDPCFLYKMVKKKLTGVTGLASDDSINTGDKSYQTAEDKATKEFITRKNDDTLLRFLGLVIEKFDSHIEVYQDNHIDRLQLLNIKTLDRDKFRTIRRQLLFIAQSSRPDISYDVAQLCQVQYDNIALKHVKHLNQVVRHVKERKNMRLKYKKLDRDNLRLFVFVDSGYNTNADGTSQLGVIIFLADEANNCHFLHWSSSKCLRVTRSMLASETYAFSTGYDYGVSLRLLFKTMGMNIPLYLFTDSKSIFDTITASKRLRELRLMNDISDIRRAYRESEIKNIAWIRSPQNIADNLTRQHGNDILKNTMETGRLDFVIEQWVCKDDDAIGIRKNQSVEKARQKETNVIS